MINYEPLHEFAKKNRVSYNELCAAVRAALAKSTEPVAYIEHHKGGDNLCWDHPGGKHTPLYTPITDHPKKNAAGEIPLHRAPD